MTDYAKKLLMRVEREKELSELRNGEDAWGWDGFNEDRDKECGNTSGNAALMEIIRYKG